MKSGTTVTNSATFRISSAEAYWFIALVWEVVPVGMGGLIVLKYMFLLVVFVCQTKLPKTKIVRVFVCICIYINIQ